MSNNKVEAVADIIAQHYIVKGCTHCDDCLDKCICGHMLGEQSIEEHQAELILHALSVPNL